MLPELMASVEAGMHAASEYRYGRSRGQTSSRRRYIHQLQVSTQCKRKSFTAAQRTISYLPPLFARAGGSWQALLRLPSH
jgi:hypothetical protein